MKLRTALVAILLANFLLPTHSFATAQTNFTVSFEDLSASEPAILAGNPFYGVIDAFKSIKWRLTKRFTSAEEEFVAKQAHLDQKAAELKKAHEISKDTQNDLILKSLAEYQQTLVSYRVNLQKTADLNSEKIINQLLLHLRLIDEINAYHTPGKEQALIVDIQDQLAKSIILVSKQIQKESNLLQIYSTANQKKENPLLALRTSEILTLFSDLALVNANAELANLALEAAETQSTAFAKWFNSLSLAEQIITQSKIAQTAGTPSARKTFLR